MQDMHTQQQYPCAPDLGPVPLRVTPTAPLAKSPGLAALRRPVTTGQRVWRLLRPFRRARLKRNIKAWLPAAVKNPRSQEAEFVANWSFELRYFYGE